MLDSSVVKVFLLEAKILGAWFISAIDKGGGIVMGIIVEFRDHTVLF